MCTVGDDNIEDGLSKYMEASPSINITDKTCKKCNASKAVVVLRGKDIYCKECFIAATVHKFKGYLGKHRLVRPNDKVLVQYKPGHAITSLLHFLRTGLDLGSYKKLQFVPVIVCIEDNVEMDVEQRREVLSKIKQHVDSFKFPLHFVSLAEYIKNNQVIDGCVKDSNHESLDLRADDKNFFNENLTNGNSSIKEDCVGVYERNLLFDTAKFLGCKYIFTTEVGVDLASKLLTNVSMGRGDQLPLDVGLVDDRSASAKIMRPMRMFEVKELVFYNVLHNLEPVSVQKPKTFKKKTVHGLLKSFVENLQINYPATITTIVKTGEKLSLDNENLQETTCRLCLGPIRKVTDDLSSEESTNFSHHVSTQNLDSSIKGTDRYNVLLDSFVKENVHELCFACRIAKR